MELKSKSLFKRFFTLPPQIAPEKEQKPTRTETWMHITKKGLYLGISIFSLFFALLVALDINPGYARTILGFLFATLIPGLLLMLLLNIRTKTYWHYFVFTIGLSLIFLLVGGMIINWTLPLLSITDTPLETNTLLISFALLTITLGVLSYYRNKNVTRFPLHFPKLNTLNTVFFILPLFFPFLAVLGAFILNNNGTSNITLLMIGSILTYFFLAVALKDKLNPNVYPWAIWLMGLALLLSFSMRSYFLSSRDPNLEFMVTQFVHQASYWSISGLAGLSQANYEFMASIALLPNILVAFLEVNHHIIIKLFFQILYSIVPVTLYLCFNTHFSKLHSFLASAFFIFQPMFFTSLIQLSPRQEIAFIFLSLMLLVAFATEIRPTIRKTLFIIFGVGMILSHYSTTYIALAFFTLTYLSILCYKAYEKRHIRKTKTIVYHKEKFYLNGMVLAYLLFFGFIWYVQVTPTADTLFNFAEKSIDNIDNIFNRELQSTEQSVFEQFNLFGKQENPPSMEEQAAEIVATFKEQYPNHNYYDPKTYADYSFEPKISGDPAKEDRAAAATTVTGIRQILKALGSLFISIGTTYYLVAQFLRKNEPFKKQNLEHTLMILIAFILLVGLLVLPFISLSYDTGRTYQQMLFVLSPMLLFGLGPLLNHKRQVLFFTLFIALYFLFLSGTVHHFFGGPETKLFLANHGYEHDSLYTHQSDIASGEWLYTHYDPDKTIYIDSFSSYKLLLSQKIRLQREFNPNIFPEVIQKDDYVYLDYNNFANDQAIKLTKIAPLTYNYPDEFLEDNKNLVYSNGESVIFK